MSYLEDIKKLKEELNIIKSKLDDLELRQNRFINNHAIIEKEDFSNLEIKHQENGQILFHYKNCSFLEEENSELHKGLLNGSLNYIVLNKLPNSLTWQHRYSISHKSLSPTEAAIILNFTINNR
ncbi:hypothetical protein [Aquirufa aurantiipilula]|uniref:hypothetical protein n=1 Tax=Aquirufa aurantiipilula TaxID=2696561 RepID=UPI001CAA7265|nr:hypothetical protein [Aquirufa aurantiipilula]MBZ1325619.1 hypothetical protein [Aquirufa aurantiipilula]